MRLCTQGRLIYNLRMLLGIYFRRTIAIPQDHGSWVFLFSPLLIGLFAGEDFSQGTWALITAAITVFLIRQPITTAAKVKSGRRPRSDMPAAIFWICLYGLVLSFSLTYLIYLEYFFLLTLAIPGITVFAWHLYLVSKRNDRGQAGVEILATGALALSAPAAYWVSSGIFSPDGWWLWILTWLQSAASIIYAYLRLEQRSLQDLPSRQKRITLGKRALRYSSFNLVLTVVLSIANILPTLIFLPYLLQWLETIWGIFHPAIGYRPTRIGFRQLAISSIFTIIFILVWR